MKKEKSIENSEKEKSFYRNSSNPQNIENLIEILSWYKEQKYKKRNHNWFEKVVFLDRNYWKVEQYLKSALEMGKTRGKKIHIESQPNSKQESSLNKGKDKASPNLGKKSFSYQKLKN